MPEIQQHVCWLPDTPVIYIITVPFKDSAYQLCEV